VLWRLPNWNWKLLFLSEPRRTKTEVFWNHVRMWAVFTKAISFRSFRECILYAIGGTLHPRLNMQTISDTQSCALCQFYDWLFHRNVSMIDSGDCRHHCLLVEGFGGQDPVLLRLGVRGGWYKVIVSFLLLPLQPPPVWWTIKQPSRAVDDAGAFWSSYVMRPVSSCRTCTDARKLGFPRYNRSWYDAPSIGCDTILIWESSVL